MPNLLKLFSEGSTLPNKKRTSCLTQDVRLIRQENTVSTLYHPPRRLISVMAASSSSFNGVLSSFPNGLEGE